MYPDSYTILLVEDSPGDARLVELVLADVDDALFKIRHVERLSQALGVVGAGAFDAVLLDLSLPDSHGLETVEQLKAADPTVPIIVLSGLLDEATAIQAVKTGAQDYLVKGQENGYLMSRAIRYAIERKRSEEALRKAHDELERRVEERTAELVAANQRLRAEIAERKQSEAAKQQSERQLRLITDALPVLITHIDSEQCYQFNNKAYEDWFDCSCAEIQGRSIQEVLGEAAYEKIRHHVQTALSGTPVNFEGVMPFKLGDARYVSAAFIPDCESSSNTRGFFALIHDITDRKKAEDQERQHLLQLAHVSRLSTMGEMATEIAHEINQPLTAIASYGDTCLRMLKKDNWERDDLLGALRQITDQAERAGEVIRQLRDFVRKNDSHRSTVDINELVHEIVRLIEVETRWHNVDVQLKPAETTSAVLANRVLIQQVLLNFVRNAIEAMADASNGMQRLTIQTIVDDDVVEVAVHDTGPGLPPEGADQMFEAFYTTKADGMGMGLSICESIIKAHEGRLWAASNDDGGCTFVFSLPLIRGGGRYR